MEVCQRGITPTQIGYTPAAWHGLSNRQEVRLRVVPDGPLSEAWQGVQRINELSKVGTMRAAQYGTFPTSPYQTYQSRNARVNQNNQAAFSFGAGMVTAQMQDQANDDYFAAQAEGQAQPSFLASFLGRIRNG